MKYTLKPVESWFSSLKHKVMDKKKHRREDNEEDDDGDVNSRWSYHTFLKRIRPIYR